MTILFYRDYCIKALVVYVDIMSHYSIINFNRINFWTEYSTRLLQRWDDKKMIKNYYAKIYFIILFQYLIIKNVFIKCDNYENIWFFYWKRV